MKAESNIMPQSPFVVEKRGNLADITFFANPISSAKDGEVIWEYDTYTLTIPYRNELEAMIAEEYELWLNAAINTEQTASLPKEPSLVDRISGLEEVQLETLLGGA
jgi:hypothetical protein